MLLPAVAAVTTAPAAAGASDTACTDATTDIPAVTAAPAAADAADATSVNSTDDTATSNG